jgi:hypothetical protein
MKTATTTASLWRRSGVRTGTSCERRSPTAAEFASCCRNN